MNSDNDINQKRGEDIAQESSSYVQAKLYKAVIRAVLVSWSPDAAQSLPNRLKFADWLSQLFDVPPNVHKKIVGRAIQQNNSLAEEFRQLILGLQDQGDTSSEAGTSQSTNPPRKIPSLNLRTKRPGSEIQPSISETNEVQETREIQKQDSFSSLGDQPNSARSWAGRMPPTRPSTLEGTTSGSITSRSKRNKSNKNKQSPLRSAADPLHSPAHFMSQNEYNQWQKTEILQLQVLQKTFEKLPNFNGALQVSVQRGGNLKQQQFFFSQLSCGEKQLDANSVSPYCMVSLAGGRGHNNVNRDFQRTPVARGTADPQWGFQCKHIVLEDLETALDIEVRHDDPLGYDTVLGRQRLWVEDIAGDPDREWVLQISKKKSKKKSRWNKSLKNILGTLNDEKPYVALYIRLIMEERTLPEGYNAAKMFALSRREALDGLKTLTEAIWSLWMGGQDSVGGAVRGQIQPVLRTLSMGSMAPSRVSSMLASIDRVRGQFSTNMDEASGTREEGEVEAEEEWERRKSVDWTELARRLGQLKDTVPELDMPRMSGFGYYIADIDPQEEGTQFFPSKSHRQILQSFSMLYRIHPIQAILELLKCMLEDWKMHPSFVKAVHALWRAATSSKDNGGITADQMHQYRQCRLHIVNRCDQVLRAYRTSFPKLSAIEGLRNLLELLKITLNEDSQSEFIDYVKRRLQDAVETWIRSRKISLERDSLSSQDYLKRVDETITECIHCCVMDLDLQMAFPQSVKLPQFAAKLQYKYIEQVVVGVLNLQALDLRSDFPDLRNVVYVKQQFDEFNKFIQAQELGDFGDKEGVNLVNVDNLLPSTIRVWIKSQHAFVDRQIQNCISAEQSEQKGVWVAQQNLHSISVQVLFESIQIMLKDVEYFLNACPQICGEVLWNTMDIVWIILIKYMSKLEENAFELLVQNITQEQVEDLEQSVHSMDFWEADENVQEGRTPSLSFNDNLFSSVSGRISASAYALAPISTSRPASRRDFSPDRRGGTPLARSQTAKEHTLELENLSLHEGEARYNTDDEGEEENQSLRRSRSSIPWSMDMDQTQSGSLFVNLDIGSNQRNNSLGQETPFFSHSDKLPKNVSGARRFSLAQTPDNIAPEKLPRVLSPPHRSRTQTPTNLFSRSRPNIRGRTPTRSTSSNQGQTQGWGLGSSSRIPSRSPSFNPLSNTPVDYSKAMTVEMKNQSKTFNGRSLSPTGSMVVYEDEGVYGGWETPLSTVREIYHQSAYKLHMERESVVTKEVCVILNNLQYVFEKCNSIKQQIVDDFMKDKMRDPNERLKIRMRGEWRFGLVKEFAERTQLNIIGCIYRLLKGELANKIFDVLMSSKDFDEPLSASPVVDYIQNELNIILRSTLQQPCSQLIFYCWECLLDTLCGVIVGSLGYTEQINSRQSKSTTVDFLQDCLKNVKMLFQLEELINSNDLEKSQSTFFELLQLKRVDAETLKSRFDNVVKSITNDRLSSRAKNNTKKNQQNQIKLLPTSVGIRLQNDGIQIPDLLCLIPLHMPNLIAKSLFKKGLKLAKQMPLQVIFGLPPSERIIYHCACVYSMFEVAGTLFLTTDYLAFTSLYFQKGDDSVHKFAIPLSQITLLDTLKIQNNRALLVQQFDEVDFVFYKFYQGQRDKFFSQMKQHLTGTLNFLDRTWSFQ